MTLKIAFQQLSISGSISKCRMQFLRFIHKKPFTGISKKLVPDEEHEKQDRDASTDGQPRC